MDMQRYSLALNLVKGDFLHLIKKSQKMNARHRASMWCGMLPEAWILLRVNINDKIKLV